MKVSCVLEGADGLERLIESMPTKLARKGIRRAVKTAHNEIHTSILRKIADLPNSGRHDRPSLKLAMLMSFRSRPARRHRAGTYSYDDLFVNAVQAGLVYFSKGVRGKAQRRTFIPFALEYGHGSDKSSAARPFMRPGADTAAPKAFSVLSEEMRKELDALVAEARGSAT